ncbi:carbohydrate porin [Sphingomonas oligophenolica]|uniref:carbohydrate porin n=1 Tax=Sphingomonas oligophenolica TaxID=301154 RepID=UPI0031F5B543
MIGLAMGMVAWSGPAAADESQPSVSLSARDTFDIWDVADGGVRRGTVALNKLQLGGTVQGDDFGLAGFSVHGQIFRTDGRSLSGRIGDIQTADNIETPPVTRLFEAWIEKRFGNDERSLAFRAGLIDLNADFDSIETAGLMLSSSHGVGPDLSKSGVDGPSIFPVTSLALEMSWLPSKRWTFRVAAFDGVSGDPGRPAVFVSARLSPRDGALVIGQADYHLSDAARIEVGLWRYSRALPAIGPGAAHDQGIYASLDTPVPHAKGWRAWGRAGLASGSVQAVSGYLGAGLVRQGPLKDRPDDQIGIAIARAEIGAPAMTALGLPNAETSIEATYQLKLGNSVAVQPDVQYVIHPAGEAGVRTALAMGLRLVLTAGFPKKAPAADSADPTAPPDGPPPPDTGAPPT